MVTKVKEEKQVALKRKWATLLDKKNANAPFKDKATGFDVKVMLNEQEEVIEDVSGNPWRVVLDPLSGKPMTDEKGDVMKDPDSSK